MAEKSSEFKYQENDSNFSFFLTGLGLSLIFFRRAEPLSLQHKIQVENQYFLFLMWLAQFDLY